MKATKYTVTIAFNHGNDSASRRIVSRHSSPRAALLAYRAAQGDTGWAPRIDCADSAACNELFAAAKKLWSHPRAEDFRRAAESAVVLT